MRRWVAGSACAALIVLGSGAAAASPVPQSARFDTACVPTDPGLGELSGLTKIGSSLYAIGDSGTDHRVAVLDERCVVTRWLDVPVDPYDVEDLASYGGTLWLSDTGDNLGRRDTVALTRMDPETGAGDLRRLTYPDGAHDAEALVIEPGGRPVIVTKEFSGIAGVYVPEDDSSVDALAAPGPTPLRKVGEILLERTQTPGGPPFIGGSSAITGGAMSVDGSVAAVRTYTDAYLYAVTDGDVASALIHADSAVALALPDQPQGEALAFDASGGLLIASEAAGGPLPPIQILPGAVSMVGQQNTATTDSDTPSSDAFRVAVVAGLVAAVAAIGFGIRSRRRRR